jgi:hypothetical protein
MPNQLSSAYWRSRGEETRTLAEALHNEHLQRSLLEIAEQYDKLAEFTEQQERRPPSPPPARASG